MSRGSSIYHYAMKSDYETVIADVSSQISVKFVSDDWRVEPDFPVYSSPLNAPAFGICPAPHVPGITFLIFPEGAELPYEYWPNRQTLDPSGVPKKYGFNIGRDLNYRCVVFHPCGFHQSEQWGEGLFQGWLTTNSKNLESLAIFNAFKKSIKKRFEYFRFSGAYVGPDAVKYFEAGGRLAPDLRRPRESDARRVQCI